MDLQPPGEIFMDGEELAIDPAYLWGRKEIKGNTEVELSAHRSKMVNLARAEGKATIGQQRPSAARAGTQESDRNFSEIMRRLSRRSSQFGRRQSTVSSSLIQGQFSAIFNTKDDYCKLVTQVTVNPRQRIP